MAARIFLALGANVGDKKGNIGKAIEMLKEKVVIEKQAPLYGTRPKGYEFQENFLNTALLGQTELRPEELLLFVKEIEQRLGRVMRMRNGPREIDIDILLYDDVVLNSENLQIPHPRIAERDFVLQPLLDLDDSVVHPILKVPLKKLLANLGNDRYIVRKYE